MLRSRNNADWVTEGKVGMVVPSFRCVAEAAELLKPENLACYRARAAA